MKKKEIEREKPGVENELDLVVERAIKMLPLFLDEAKVLFEEYFKKRDLKVDDKTQTDFVTEADKEIESLFISWTKQHFPEAAILGEEHGVDYNPASQEWLWAIDPIDGTTNFLNGNPECSIVVSLRYKEEPVLAVCALPLKNEEYVAIKDRGFYMNGILQEEPFRQTELHRALLIVTHINKYSRLEQFVGELWDKVGGILMKMSSVSEVCTVAAGEAGFGVWYGMGAYEWPAAYLFAVESGCEIGEIGSLDNVFDFTGIERKNVLVSGSKDLFEQAKKYVSIPDPLTAD